MGNLESKINLERSEQLYIQIKWGGEREVGGGIN